MRTEKNEDKDIARAGGLAWLRYRLDMADGNDLNIIHKEFDKQTLLANQLHTENKESERFQEKEVIWDNYKKYLLSKVSKTTTSNLFRYAKQYYYVLQSRNASDLQLLTQEKRIHVMKALSSLSKFIGIHSEWKRLIENFDLKWTNSNHTNNTFLIFNTDATDMNKMIHWLKDSAGQLPDKYTNILLFATLTGLRPCECWYSIRLIQNDKDHYVSKGKLLHYQYPDIFLRRTKKVFISLASEQIIVIAEQADIKKPYPQLCKIFRSKNLSMNMYYCRKIFATYLRDNGIESEIIDLLQGRIPKSMFLRHYYRPDINEIVTKKIRPVLDELRRNC
ncbi:integrase [Candidatus Nitrosocosmicus sp. FF01]|uniref:integrase n=1 Tax=Candidatus Nitrosocosmicus sp. FF01 TaxID=3397670 RepID=UPI0039E9E8BB